MVEDGESGVALGFVLIAAEEAELGEGWDSVAVGDGHNVAGVEGGGGLIEVGGWQGGGKGEVAEYGEEEDSECSEIHGCFR